MNINNKRATFRVVEFLQNSKRDAFEELKVSIKENTTYDAPVDNLFFCLAHPARVEVWNLLDGGDVHEVGLGTVHAPVPC